VADFAEITIDIMLRRTGNNEARIFDFGTGETECFYLAIEDNGKPVLVAKHQGETRRLAASETVPANKWARVRVEINGSAASIYIDAKQVAKKDFKFNPPAVFPGDATEGNFIACGRNKTGFFHGKMDYLRIYRKVHDVFSTLGEVPLPLTQIISKDSCELAQQLSADWQKRRGEKEAEIRSGKYGEMQTEIRQLNERQKTFLKTPKLAELEDRRRQTYRNRDRLHQGIREEFDSLPETKKAGQRLQELRENLKALTAKLEKSHPEVSKLEESVRQTQRSLDTARKLFTTERQTRRKDDFANVAKEITAAEKAIEDEKKRIEREKSKELGEIASRIEKLQQQSNDLWRETLSKAGLSRNPYGGMADVNRMQYQQNLEYHTTADWDERTREEISGKVTPTMKEWLLRVRGY